MTDDDDGDDASVVTIVLAQPPHRIVTVSVIVFGQARSPRMSGMLRSTAACVTLIVTGWWGRAPPEAVGSCQSHDRRVRVGHRARWQRCVPHHGPVRGLGLHAEEVAHDDDAHDEHEQEGQDEDELDGDDASVVTVGCGCRAGSWE